MRHVVQQQIIELSAPSLGLAQRWEGRIGDLLQDVVTPSLERCFDESADEHINVLIEHLELDLGVLHEGMSRQEITDRVINVARKALRASGMFPDSGKQDRPLASGDPENSELRRRELDRQGSTFECFIHFLLQGRLPWWAEAGRVDLEGDWIEHVSVPHVGHMAQTLSTQPESIERLAQQFSIGFIAKVLNLFMPEKSGDVLEGWRWLERFEPTRGPRYAELSKEYWVYWISKAAGARPDESRITRVLKQWLQHMPEAKSRASTLLAGTRFGRMDLSEKSVYPALDELLASALENITETTPSLPAQERISEQPIRDDHLEKRRSNSRLPAAHEMDPPEQSHKAGVGQNPPGIRTGPPASERPNLIDNAKQGFKLQEDETALYVEAAGLVLLHPFLPELFRIARLWNDKEWTSPQAQHGAVHLVAWLAHGATDLPEYRLLMPKLLCGMPWETALDTTATLVADQVRSAIELLESVVGHWRALGKTSIDGLREGFILREGWLAPTTDGWRLTVEQKALDVLLGKLPWGISVIQLPWMRGTRIHVDWA